MPSSSLYTIFKSVMTNRPDKLTAANILKKGFLCRTVWGTGRCVVVEYLRATGGVPGMTANRACARAIAQARE